MRAAVHTRYGPPDVVQVVEAPMPHVGAGDVLVQIHVASVNRTDCGFRAASPFIARLFTGLRQPKQTILGNEFAGEVVEVGRHVTSFTIGDRVFGYNEGPFGCHAEYLSIPEQASIAPTPDGIPHEIAAASTEGAHYALSFIRAARIRGGKSTFARSRRILTPHGIYLSSELGPWIQNPVLALATPLLRKQRVMFPIPKHDRQIVTYIGELVHSGAFVPLIDRVYPLEDIVEAYRYVESGQKVGNVLITVV